MGFYSPAVLVKDAQRHGVRVRPIDVTLSAVDCEVTADAEMRLGLSYVSGLRREAAEAIVAKRPYRSMEDFVRRTRLTKPELDVLAEIGALNQLGEGVHRREALWQIERAYRPVGPLFESQDDSLPAPGPLAQMTCSNARRRLPRFGHDHRASPDALPAPCPNRAQRVQCTRARIHPARPPGASPTP
ncbi:MAG: hypothetical protein R2748_14760 [Bryobacterales bacterium]